MLCPAPMRGAAQVQRGGRERRMAQASHLRAFAKEAIAPLAAFAAFLALWEGLVRLRGIPPYVLPAPSLILSRLIEDRALMASSLWVTVKIAMEA